jgi:hypothetical protein
LTKTHTDNKSKITFPLDYVSQTTSLTTDELLEFATRSDLRLFVRISPDEGKVACVNYLSLDIQESKNSRGMPYPIDLRDHRPVNFIHHIPRGSIESNIVEGLYLSAHDCKEIMNQGYFEQIIFDSGLLIRNRTIAKEVVPHDNKFKDQALKTVEFNFWKFAFYPTNKDSTNEKSMFDNSCNNNEKPKYIKLDPSKLYVTSTDFEQFKASRLLPTTRPEPDDDFIRHPNKAKYLVGLDQAAFELYGKFNPQIMKQYNSVTQVANFLSSKFAFEFESDSESKFSKNIAHTAAKFIFQKFDDCQQNNDFHYRTDLFKILIQGWELHYANETPETYKSKEDITKWFADRLNKASFLQINNSDATNASTIIKPDNAKKGKRSTNF